MSGQHRFTIKASPTTHSCADKSLLKERGKSTGQRKPVVAPFKVKWPDACQLHQVISKHEHNKGQQPLATRTIQPVMAGNNMRLLALTITAFNIAGVTLLGWCLFQKIFSGKLFIGLELILVLSAGVTLWWSGTITADASKQVEAEDIYDEDDFIVH